MRCLCTSIEKLFRNLGDTIVLACEMFTEPVSTCGSKKLCQNVHGWNDFSLVWFWFSLSSNSDNYFSPFFNFWISATHYSLSELLRENTVTSKVFQVVSYSKWSYCGSLIHPFILLVLNKRCSIKNLEELSWKRTLEKMDSSRSPWKHHHQFSGLHNNEREKIVLYW